MWNWSELLSQLASLPSLRLCSAPAPGTPRGGAEFCCPPAVDGGTWLAVMGALAVGTFFLQQQITANLGRSWRSRAGQSLLVLGTTGSPFIFFS